MPRDLDAQCKSVIEAYFLRRSPTIRALEERSGLRKSSALIAGESDLRETRDRDRRICEWLLSEASEDDRRYYARCMLIAWYAETMSIVDPRWLPELLQFDIGYLHVLEYSTQLSRGRPLGIDPLGVDARNAFAKGVRDIFFRPRTSLQKFPEPGELLSRYEHIKKTLEEASNNVERRLMRGSPQPYVSLDVQRQVELVGLATWFPADDIAAAYNEFGELDDEPAAKASIPPLHRLVWHLSDMAEAAEQSNFDLPATVIIATVFRATIGTAARKLQDARTLLSNRPIDVLLDHRNWGEFEPVPEKIPDSVVQVVAASRTAKIEGVDFEQAGRILRP